MLYHMTIKGQTPLFMNKDDVLAADEVTAWQKNPKNKGISKAGDDRQPIWKWMTSLYHDGEYVTMPSGCILKCFIEAATKITLSGKETYKKLFAQSVFFPDVNFSMSVPINANGKWGGVPLAPFLEAKQNSYTEGGDSEDPKQLMDFEDHIELARQHGFTLDVRRARPQRTGSKHVRVRPFFKAWRFEGSMEIDLALLADEQVFWDILHIAGARIGLGNWRPSLAAPGPFGCFEVELRNEKGKLVKRPSARKVRAA